MATHWSIPPMVMKEASSMRWADLCAWTDPATTNRTTKDAAIHRMRLITEAGRFGCQREGARAIPLAISNWIVSSLDVLAQGGRVGSLRDCKWILGCRSWGG